MHARDKIGSQAEIRFGFVLEVSPDPFDERRESHEGFQVLANTGAALNRCCGNDCLQTRLCASKLYNVAHLAQCFVRLNSYFDIDHPCNGKVSRLLAVILQVIGPIQAWDTRQPGHYEL